MTLPVALRFGAMFVMIALGVAILVQLLNTAVNSVIGNAAQLMVPAMIPALIEGSVFAKSKKRRLTRKEAWAFAWPAMAIATALNVAIAYLAGGIAPEFGKLAIAPFLSQQFLVLLGIYALGYLICSRFFLGIGVNNQLSAMRSKGEIE